MDNKDPFAPAPQLDLFGRVAKPLVPITRQSPILPPTSVSAPRTNQKSPAPTSSLHDARLWVRDNMDGGVECPCCEQLAKKYKRSLNAGMAASLLVILRRTSELNPIDGWLHIPDDFPARGGVVAVLRNREYPRLRFWGLLENYDGKSGGDVPHSGKWRITAAGRIFCQGKTTVPRSLYFYNGELLAERDESDRTDIKQALAEKFNYDELMGHRKTT